MPPVIHEIYELDAVRNAAKALVNQYDKQWETDVATPARRFVREARRITGRPGNGDPNSPQEGIVLGEVRLRRRRKKEDHLVVTVYRDADEQGWVEDSEHPTISFPVRWLLDPDAGKKELAEHYRSRRTGADAPRPTVPDTDHLFDRASLVRETDVPWRIAAYRKPE